MMVTTSAPRPKGKDDRWSSHHRLKSLERAARIELATFSLGSGVALKHFNTIAPETPEIRPRQFNGLRAFSGRNFAATPLVRASFRDERNQLPASALNLTHGMQFPT
jgi:hypothetical protein